MMVAYNFKKHFADIVERGEKKRTIRACRKLLNTVCVGVDNIKVAIKNLTSAKIATILMNGIPLSKSGVEAFARADGFRPSKLGWSAHHRMEYFSCAVYGVGTFQGVVIHWEKL